MKILLCHNHYQIPGGEDAVFADEAGMLEEHGHEVIRYTLHNDAIGGLNRLAVACRTVWNRAVRSDLAAVIKRRRPDVMHCTNTFPLLSPAVYYAARAASVPVVQSLHNFRMFCANGLLMRDGQVCESCLGRCAAWSGIAHGCYRESRSGSAVVAAMQAVHWTLGTWKKMVDAYIALTDFARAKYIAGGLPQDKIFVKPNFVAPDPGPGNGSGGYAIYVGRLSVEKGIETLLAAWRQVPAGLTLKIVGDGPLRPLVQAAAQSHRHIEWLGQVSRAQVQALVADAAVLALPSICYEGLPKTILEAFASGTPVVGSRLGGIAATVAHGRTGRLFAAGDAAGLAAEVERIASSPDDLAAMRLAARMEFESRYTRQRNYEMLMDIYRRAGATGTPPSTTAPALSEHVLQETPCEVTL